MAGRRRSQGRLTLKCWDTPEVSLICVTVDGNAAPARIDGAFLQLHGSPSVPDCRMRYLPVSDAQPRRLSVRALKVWTEPKSGPPSAKRPRILIRFEMDKRPLSHPSPGILARRTKGGLRVT